jgi:hypothetical protein
LLPFEKSTFAKQWAGIQIFKKIQIAGNQTIDCLFFFVMQAAYFIKWTFEIL